MKYAVARIYDIDADGNRVGVQPEILQDIVGTLHEWGVTFIDMQSAGYDADGNPIYED